MCRRAHDRDRHPRRSWNAGLNGTRQGDAAGPRRLGWADCSVTGVTLHINRDAKPALYFHSRSILTINLKLS